MPTMMQCGHVAQGKTSEGKPVCVVCYGIGGIEGADVPAPEPDLAGRTAVCHYCLRRVESNTGLAFFSHRPMLATDDYYCGCRGWD